MYSSSTTLSANNLRDHLAKPSGGWLQLNATKCASKSPSAFLAYIRLPLLPLSATSRPSTTNRSFTLSIFLMLTFSTRAISSLVERFFWLSPSSHPSRIRALRIFCDLCLPLAASPSRASRSSLVSVTTYFFIFNPPGLIMKIIYHIIYDITSMT